MRARVASSQDAGSDTLGIRHFRCRLNCDPDFGGFLLQPPASSSSDFICQFACRAYVASHLAANLDLPNIQRAIRLEPSNAEYRELLGRNLALSGASLDEAISDYRTAVHLNPYEARYWLDLAGAYQVAGRTDEQAAERRTRGGSGPNNPACRLGGGQFLLGSRRIEKRRFPISAWCSRMIRMQLILPFSFAGVQREMRIRFLTKPCHARPDLYLSFLPFARHQTGSGCRRKRLEPSDRIAADFSAEARISLFSAPHRQARSRGSENRLAAAGPS